ncbi:MAG: hypothetical protein KC417_09800, partial [Myxococcales bacterium]|nr:hypothetical protein [Myxococcales bacterium]
MTTEVNSSEEEAVESTEGEAARVEPAAADEKPDTAPVTEATMAEATDVAAEAAEAAADGDDVMVVDEEEGAAEAAPAEPSLADVLTAKLAQVEAERDRTRDQLIRTAADFD